MTTRAVYYTTGDTDKLFRYVLINTLNKQIKRLNKQKDPVVRYTLFLEMLRISFDSFVDVAEAFIQEEIEDKTDVEEKSRGSDLDKSEKSLRGLAMLRQELETYFDGFSKWISQPVYSPDHPYGNAMMKNAFDDFEEKKEEFSRNDRPSSGKYEWR